MLVTSLTDREVETLLVALRYWRNNRRTGRKADRLLSNEESDLLIAKIGVGTLSTMPEDDPALLDLYPR